MSRIGKKPVAMPSGVTASVEGQTLTVKGPKGTLSMAMLDDLVAYSIEDGAISIKPLSAAQRNRAAWGMQRTQVQNLVTGVTEGFTKVLEINGVGYRAAIQHLARVSKPGRRVYSGSRELPRIRNGLGMTIVSTPRGVLSDAEARDQNVGGEVLAEVF